jgi:hypothetical protein
MTPELITIKLSDTSFYTVQPGTTVPFPAEIANELVERGLATFVEEKPNG